MIKLYVGPEGKQYSVHVTLLTEYEWFRKKIFPYGDNSVSRNCISLVKEDPEAFELLLIWLYRKTLKAISTTDEEVAQREAALYISLYLRACAWKIFELQDALIDELRLRKTCEYGFFPRKLIKKIYESTKSPSPLRSYMVDSFLHKGIKWNEGARLADPVTGSLILTRKRALKNQLDAGNQDFVLDCYEALFQLCARSKIRDPDRRTGCVYHRHVEAGKCPSLGGKRPSLGGKRPS